MKRAMIPGVLVALALVAPASVRAQQSPLAAAEQAYLDVDFDRALELAERALRAGGNSPTELARIYELIGVTAASIGNESRSREAYVHMIALRPDAQVDRSLAPRLRAPFQEALGFWSAQHNRLGAEVTPLRARNSLRVTLTDPVDMAANVVVSSRAVGATEFREDRQPAGPSLSFDVAAMSAGPVEYYAHVLDEYGNRLIELGSEDDPREFGTVHTSGGRTGAPSGGLDDGALAAIIVSVIVVVGAGLAVGGYFLFADQGRPLHAVATFP